MYSILSQDKEECPEIESLEIICEGLGITLSKLFEFASSENDAVYFTEGERDWLEIYRSVPLERIPALMAYTKELGYAILQGSHSSIDSEAEIIIEKQTRRFRL